MFKHKFTTNWDGNGTTLTGTAEVSADSELNLEVSVPAGTTQAVRTSFPAANLKSAYILANGPVALKTNSDLEPDDTFNLVKGVPLVWIDREVDEEPALFTEDVTSLHLVNAGGTDALVSIRLLVNATA